MTLDVTVAPSVETIDVIFEGSTVFNTTLDLLSIDIVSEGVQGAPGIGAAALLPRIVALEEATDGEVNSSDPLAYYILAKNT